MTDTREILREMLTENTGRHFLDSGGAYGRHWERNAVRDFDSEEASTLSFRWGGIDVTHNVYHWLAERVDYAPELDRILDVVVSRSDEGYLGAMVETAEILEATGLYGDGAAFTVNTYNGEDLLSQTLQYQWMTLEDDARFVITTDDEGTERLERVWDDETDCETVDVAAGNYVLLQVHGGCDVRGGYTRPRAFRLWEYEETAILDNARATILCSEDHNHYWYTDDGCHWYGDGFASIADYDRVEIDFGAVRLGDIEDDETHELRAVIDEDARTGRLVVDTSADVAYCPICGSGTLGASA